MFMSFLLGGAEVEDAYDPDKDDYDPRSAPVQSAVKKVAYDPDSDDYDLRTAPVLPPKENIEDLTQKQIVALCKRIAKGGDPAVLSHYRRLVMELQQSHGIAAAGYHHPVLSHKRMASNTSDISNASTCYPHDKEASDAEDELSHEEVTPPVIRKCQPFKTAFPAYTHPVTAATCYSSSYIPITGPECTSQPRHMHFPPQSHSGLERMSTSRHVATKLTTHAPARAMPSGPAPQEAIRTVPSARSLQCVSVFYGRTTIGWGA